MSAALTPDEVQRIERIVCPAHSELVVVAGMPVAEVAAWAGAHHDCELTVYFDDDMTLIPNDDD